MEQNSELFVSAMFRMKIKFDKLFFKHFNSKQDIMLLIALKCCIDNSGSASEGSVTASNISKYMGIPKSAVSKLLNTLEEKRLITRLHSADDRRVVYISISDEGRKYLEDAKKYFDDISAAITTELGRENTEEIIRLMETVIDIIEKNTGETK